MSKNNILILIFSFIITFSVISSGAYAGMSLSPGNIQFGNVLRGGYAEQYFIVTVLGEDHRITMGPEGEFADWITISETSFEVEANERRIVKLSIEPPIDAPNGLYETMVYTTAIPLSSLANPSGIMFSTGVDFIVSAEITDVQIQNYSVDAFAVSNAEECKIIQFSVNSRNTGNVRVVPQYHVKLLDRVNRTLIKSLDYEGESLLPTQVRTDIIRIPYELEQFRCIPQGKYLISISAIMNDDVIYTNEKPFDILEPGALSILGNLKKIDYPEEVEIGQLVKIDGNFINVGEESLLSKLRCEILDSEGTLLEVVESDQREVMVSVEEMLTAYYTPLGSGDFNIKCIVSYENKVTPPVNGILTVIIPMMWIYAGIGLIIVIIILVVWRFSKKR